MREKIEGRLTANVEILPIEAAASEDAGGAARNRGDDADEFDDGDDNGNRGCGGRRRVGGCCGRETPRKCQCCQCCQWPGRSKKALYSEKPEN